MASASRIHVSEEHLGISALAAENPAASLGTANRLLQKNHDEHHMFWRTVAGHNHIAHSVLTVLALGGSPSQLRRAYDDGVDIQRAIPPVNHDAVPNLSDPAQFRARVGQLDQYTTFLAFFEREIEARGYRAVVSEYCFSGTPNAETMFAQLFEGLYHPIIHLGLGIEFDQPCIVAEGLAQAASHDSMAIEEFLCRSEKKARENIPAKPQPTAPLMQLIHGVRASETLRNAAHGSFEDGPSRVRDGVLGPDCHDLITDLAARFRIEDGQRHLKRALAEMINCSAYVSGAAQRPHKARKIDFFHLHNSTASLFVAVLARQPWISAAAKIRLVEWKSRLDLVWYAASGAAELYIDDVGDYAPGKSAGMGWTALCRAVNEVHDDGHLSKFVRALKYGQEVSRPFEHGEGGAESFPVKGDVWLKMAQMAYDTTEGLPIEQKWIWGVGFDKNWADVPSRES